MEKFNIIDGVLKKYRGKEKNIVIPNDVTEINTGAFLGAKNVVSIVIPEGVTCIKTRAFMDCPNLESVTLPESLKRIEGYAFILCENLKNLHIPKNVEYIGLAPIEACNNLNDITVSKENKTYHSEGNCIIHTESKRLIKGCKDSVIPNDGSVSIIDHYAFSNCRDMTNIVIPDTIEAIGECAFLGCVSLESIDVPGSVKIIDERAFELCTELKNIIIHDGNEGIYDSAFFGCEKIEKIVLPSPDYVFDTAISFCNADAIIECQGKCMDLVAFMRENNIH